MKYSLLNCSGKAKIRVSNKAVAKGGGGATGACAPPFLKKKLYPL